MEKARKKIAIIDGKSIFYRGYYAMGNLSMADGTPTGGVYGFAAMSLELIRKLKPDYVCVAWDKPKTNIRRRLAVHPEYKAGRKAPPEDFYKQMPLLFELLEAFSWPLYEFDDYEADDIMHTLAKKGDAAGLETMLITSDLDSLQSISEYTHVYALKKGFSNIERFDVAAFEQKYGISVSQFLDLKSLKGDSSDNIPGVPGVGEKTAAELLQKYQTLEGIYENIALIKPTVAKKLIAGKESALMSKEVARLYEDAPVELDLEDMDVTDLDTERLKGLLQKLEFRSLLRNLPDHMQHDEGPEVHSTNGTSSSLKLAKITQITNVEEAQKLKSLDGVKEVVLYCRAADSLGRDPRVLVFASEAETFVVDCVKMGADLSQVVQEFRPASVIGHDLKHVFRTLLSLGMPLPEIAHDTFIGGYLINSLQRETSLTDMLARDLGIETELDNIDEAELLHRVDVLVAGIRKLSALQSEQMSELTGLIKLAEDIEWPIIPVLAKMEVTGIKLNAPYLEKMSQEFEGIISDIEQQIYGHAGQEFNISSPSQLSKVLFEDLELSTKGVKKGKTAYSTAAGELDKLRWTHPIINLITKYREYTKLKSTYVDGLPALESYYTDLLGFNSLIYKEYFKTTGYGLNLKIGGVYRVSSEFRLGAYFHTPTILYLTDTYYYTMNGYFDKNTSTPKEAKFPTEEEQGKSIYRVITPMRYGFNSAYIINKMLAIALDLERVDYGNSSITSTTPSDFAGVNAVIKSKYKTATNIRVGTELNVKPVMIRAGYAMYGSPFGGIFKGPFDRQTASVGLGIRTKSNLFFDITWAKTFTKEHYYMYSTDAVKTDLSLTNTNFLVAVGLKF